MSSAYSITRSVNPPRAVYLDFPLGRTAGKANDKPLQRKIIFEMEGQIAFHFKDDFSYREIPRKTAREKLRATHFAYDLTDARSDPNVVFPQDTLQDLAQLSRIRELGPNAYTFMEGNLAFAVDATRGNQRNPRIL